ncbi:MAG TPA: DUF732 domain-containing protein [Candidatus Limnocylindrales bacterium]|nr:DUF732 domain-containing protein [Candidatus Limnocylindrales bacterium]
MELVVRFIFVVILWNLILQQASAQSLSQKDYDFYTIVVTNAQRMGVGMRQSPEAIVAAAKKICQDIQQLGAPKVIENNRQQASAAIQNVDESTKRQVADMFFRNAISTYCDHQIQKAYDALFNTAQNNTTPAPGSNYSEAGPNRDDLMYGRFTDLAARSNIDLQQHLSYTKPYVVDRAGYFCRLMRGGDIPKLTAEIAFPPIQSWGKTSKDQSRLEVVILITGTEAYCPDQTSTVDQWRRTYER